MRDDYPIGDHQKAIETCRLRIESGDGETLDCLEDMLRFILLSDYVYKRYAIIKRKKEGPISDEEAMLLNGKMGSIGDLYCACIDFVPDWTLEDDLVEALWRELNFGHGFIRTGKDIDKFVEEFNAQVAEDSGGDQEASTSGSGGNGSES